MENTGDRFADFGNEKQAKTLKFVLRLSKFGPQEKKCCILRVHRQNSSKSVFL